ncbi:hypothetical protein J3P77_09555 [Pseudomonas sp. R1-18]|uniref:hypothetical protein n=1 Tax=Pseudomonas sp. R1-18 TaxID=1632772 RepID=UPI003DA7C599
MKKFLLLPLMASTLLLTACGEKDAGSCADGGSESFFKSSLDSYYTRNNPDMVGKYQLVESAKYDSTTNWWMVPVDAEGRKLLALISCDGRLELSGRK